MTRFLKIALSVFFLILITCSFQSCRSKGAFNKYRNAKVRPSEQQMRSDKKAIKKGNKAYKKQVRRNRKHLFGRSVAPK